MLWRVPGWSFAMPNYACHHPKTSRPLRLAHAVLPLVDHPASIHYGGIVQRTILSSVIGFILTAHLLPAASVYDYELSTINCEKVHLREFKGKVLMIVNVASYCGYTP